MTDYKNMTKAQLAKRIQEMEDIASRLREEVGVDDEYPFHLLADELKRRNDEVNLKNHRAEERFENEIINLQKRVFTLNHIITRNNEVINGLNWQVEGLRKVNKNGLRPRFDIRDPSVQDTLSRLMSSLVSGAEVTFQACPECGAVMVGASDSNGCRLCEACIQALEWPYPNEEDHTKLKVDTWRHQYSQAK